MTPYLDDKNGIADGSMNNMDLSEYGFDWRLFGKADRQRPRQGREIMNVRFAEYTAENNF